MKRSGTLFSAVLTEFSCADGTAGAGPGLRGRLSAAAFRAEVTCVDSTAGTGPGLRGKLSAAAFGAEFSRVDGTAGTGPAFRGRGLCLLHLHGIGLRSG